MCRRKTDATLPSEERSHQPPVSVSAGSLFKHVLADGEGGGQTPPSRISLHPRRSQPYLRDFHDHVRRFEVMVAGLRDVVKSMFEVSNLLEQQRRGAMTRQLASWAAILAVPTPIASTNYMNFLYMPKSQTRYGYLVVPGSSPWSAPISPSASRRLNWCSLPIPPVVSVGNLSDETES